jgi:hypothetical protein
MRNHSSFTAACVPRISSTIGHSIKSEFFTAGRGEEAPLPKASKIQYLRHSGRDLPHLDHSEQ